MSTQSSYTFLLPPEKHAIDRYMWWTLFLLYLPLENNKSVDHWKHAFEVICCLDLIFLQMICGEQCTLI
jgi:hypothetical protein